MASVTLKDISKKFENNQIVLQNFDLTIQDSEFLVLVGPSGCGKSTLLRMIAGLESISSGELYIDQCLMNEAEPKDRNLAMVFQNYSLYGHMSVYQNIAFSLKIRKKSKKEVKKKVLEVAQLLEIEELLSRKPKELSGGQRQRVALGRSIVRDPSVFLLDEPLSNLDAKLREVLRLEIIKLHQRLNTTFIYVTHDQTEAMTMGDRIVIMKDGVIQQVDTPKRIYEEPVNMFVAGFIGLPPMNFIEGILYYDTEINQYYIQVGENSFYLKNTLRCPKMDAYLERKIVIGIRPEHIFIEPRSLNLENQKKLHLKLELQEMIGHATFLYLDFNHKSLAVRTNSACFFDKGKTIAVYLDTSQFHLFDPESERAIFVS